jgi:hypothetical protein
MASVLLRLPSALLGGARFKGAPLAGRCEHVDSTFGDALSWRDDTVARCARDGGLGPPDMVWLRKARAPSGGQSFPERLFSLCVPRHRLLHTVGARQKAPIIFSSVPKCRRCATEARARLLELPTEDVSRSSPAAADGYSNILSRLRSGCDSADRHESRAVHRNVHTGAFVAFAGPQSGAEACASRLH